MLENRPDEICQFIDGYLNRLWGEASDNNKSIDEQHTQEEAEFVSSPLEQDENVTAILQTPCR